MVLRFKETCHPIFTSASALSRGILRKLKGKETIHFYADTSNTELLFRIIQCANQLSFFGAFSTWWEELGLKPYERGPKLADKENSVHREMLKSVDSQEVKSVVFAQRTRAASGNGLRENLQNFQSLSNAIQYTRICELASFWYRVDVGMKYKTIPDVVHGFGDFIPACREYILPRLDLNSRVFSAIPGGTVWLGQFSKVTSYFFMENMDLNSRFHLRMTQNEHPGLWYAEERIDSWMSCISQIQNTTNSPVQNCLMNCKKSNLVQWNKSQAALGKLVRNNSGLFLIRYASRKKSYLWKKGLAKYSCQWIVQVHVSFCRDLENGHEIVASLWPRWARNRRSSSLEYCKSKITESIRTSKSTSVKDWLQTLSWRK